METLVADLFPDPEFWRGKRVFLTGHTGFKCGWLTVWLHSLGAVCRGYSLAPPSTPSLFEAAGLADLIDHQEADILDAPRLAASLREFAPDVAVHMAAQALVRRSYAEPLYTFAANVMGTANFLDACRNVPSLRSVVVITTDKCYENKSWHYPYREIDRLGGHDPYSASKACAELTADSWRRSFLAPENGPAMATARAGNVIGGGDWAEDRLIPDAARAFSQGQPLAIRNPEAVRPWQHVLDPLAGYLMLAKALHQQGEAFAQAFNFGPSPQQVVSVRKVADAFVTAWGEPARALMAPKTKAPHEAALLLLDSAKARRLLGWAPRMAAGEALRATADWYKRFYAGDDPEQLLDLTRRQIAAYVDARTAEGEL